MNTMSKILTEKREEFQKIMAKYFYIIGCDEVSEDIQTESHEKLLLDAYLFGIKYFETSIDNYEKNQKMKGSEK